MHDWNDLQYFFAVAEHRTLSAAALTLRVNHTTVARRISALEDSYKVSLFERSPTGYGLTAAGASLALHASAMRDAVGLAERTLAAHETEMVGPLTITAPTALVLHVLTPMIAKFSAEFPEIEVKVFSDERVASLSRREADIAIRATNSPDDTLMGRNLVTFYNAVYCAPDLLPQKTEAQLQWIQVLDDGAGGHWGVDKSLLAPQPICVVSGKAEAIAAAEAGVGAAFLPCRIGDTSPKLERVPTSQVQRGPDIWLLYHKDLAANPRLQAFSRFAYKAFATEKEMFEGQRT